jgi:hypothetical protein
VVTYHGSAKEKGDKREHGCEANGGEETRTKAVKTKRQKRRRADGIERWGVIGEKVGPPVRKEEKRVRRRRADYGSVKASERDLELLELIGEQYAITVPQLARLIERRLDTARSLRDRWKRAGWINSGQLSVQAPSFVWLTARGAANSGFRVWEPNATLALHIEAVTNIRIELEYGLPDGEWECERAVAQRLAKTQGRFHRGHLPDAVLHLPGGERIAIEVELTLKNRTRLKEIIQETSLRYDSVWYFAKPKPFAVLDKLAEASSRGNVYIRTYPFTNNVVSL